jgi:fumarylacetoacetate (FAA) hydrolase
MRMKLASLKSGRDGRLVVVSDDLAWCADAGHIAPTLQAALDGWTWIEPALRNLAVDLAHGMIPKERFHERAAASPLPRAFQYLRGAGADSTLFAQCGSGAFGGPRDALQSAGCTVQAELVVVSGDVPMGASTEDAQKLIRLVGLSSAVSGHAAAFSPVFVTPETLGGQWQGGRLIGTLSTDVDGHSSGRDDVAKVMKRDFGQLVSHAAKDRGLSVGTIISSGPVSGEQTVTASVRIWMDDAKHHPIFGVIEHAAEGV